MCGNVSGVEQVYTRWWTDSGGWEPAGSWRWLGGRFPLLSDVAVVARTQQI
jgi:hypothetical protein